MSLFISSRLLPWNEISWCSPFDEGRKGFPESNDDDADDDDDNDDEGEVFNDGLSV